MAKKSKAPDLPSWWPTGFQPSVCRNPATVAQGSLNGLVFMLAPTFQGTLAVERRLLTANMLGVFDRVIANGSMHLYTIADGIDLHSALIQLKEVMLTEGATPEAVRLVGEHIPISKKEYDIMAEKLTKKTTAAAKKPAATAAAKAAPKTKAKAEGEGSGGSTAQDFKYKKEMTQKQAAEKTREGTWTARMVEIALNNTDSAAARAELAGDAKFGDKSEKPKRMDFGWLKKQGFISY